MFKKDIYKLAKKSSKQKDNTTILILTLAITPLESGKVRFIPRITADLPKEATREMWLDMLRVAKGSIEELESALDKRGVEFLQNDTKNRVIHLS